MKYLQNINTIEELKSLYRKLAFILHPDKGGNLENMQILNSEYDTLLKTLKHTAKADVNEYEYAENFKEIIERLINCPGLEIEICGSWLWVTGTTGLYVELFHELGFHWAKKKISWYLGTRSSKKHYGELPMEKIREIHGSKKITSNMKPSLT